MVRYVHLMVKYLSEKYQLVKMKINGVHDCPTLLKKTCSNFPHHSAFSQQLQTGTNGRPGYIQWGNFEQH